MVIFTIDRGIGERWNDLVDGLREDDLPDDLAA
jgi:hypothetical protein